jgi:hypothetical protein
MLSLMRLNCLSSVSRDGVAGVTLEECKHNVVKSACLHFTLGRMMKLIVTRF